MLGNLIDSPAFERLYWTQKSELSLLKLISSCLSRDAVNELQTSCFETNSHKARRLEFRTHSSDRSQSGWMWMRSMLSSVEGWVILDSSLTWWLSKHETKQQTICCLVLFYVIHSPRNPVQAVCHRVWRQIANTVIGKSDYKLWFEHQSFAVCIACWLWLRCIAFGNSQAKQFS